jgi:hypothetical protein
VLESQLLVDGVQQQQQQVAAVSANIAGPQQPFLSHDIGVAVEAVCASAGTGAAVCEHIHSQQQAVHTAGMPFTLVTSVLGDLSIAAAAAGSSKRQLQAQLQQLEHQAAQLVSADLVETPRLAEATADGAVPVGSSGSHAKKLTAGKARAAAKHLHASPEDTAATTSSSSSATAGGSKNPHAHVASPAAGYGGWKSSKPQAAVEAAVATTPPYSSCVPVCPAQPVVGKAAPAAVASVDRTAHAVVGGDAAKIVNAATRAGPAHMQDIWA